MQDLRPMLAVFRSQAFSPRQARRPIVPEFELQLPAPLQACGAYVRRLGREAALVEV